MPPAIRAVLEGNTCRAPFRIRLFDSPSSLPRCEGGADGHNRA